VVFGIFEHWPQGTRRVLSVTDSWLMLFPMVGFFRDLTVYLSQLSGVLSARVATVMSAFGGALGDCGIPSQTRAPVVCHSFALVAGSCLRLILESYQNVEGA